MAKTLEQRIIDAIERGFGKSLTNVKPYMISGTDVHEGINGYAILAFTDITFTTIDTVTDGDDLTTMTIPAGVSFPVNIRGTVQLAGGSGAIYQN